MVSQVQPGLDVKNALQLMGEVITQRCDPGPQSFSMKWPWMQTNYTTTHSIFSQNMPNPYHTWFFDIFGYPIEFPLNPIEPHSCWCPQCSKQKRLRSSCHWLPPSFAWIMLRQDSKVTTWCAKRHLQADVGTSHVCRILWIGVSENELYGKMLVINLRIWKHPISGPYSQFF